MVLNTYQLQNNCIKPLIKRRGMFKQEVKLTIIRSQSPGELSAKCRRGGNKKEEELLETLQ